MATLTEPRYSLFASGLNYRDFRQIIRQIVGFKGFNIHFNEADERAAKLRLGLPASIHDHGNRGNDTAMLVHDIDCLLNASTASHNILDHNKLLAFVDF